MEQKKRQRCFESSSHTPLDAKSFMVLGLEGRSPPRTSAPADGSGPPKLSQQSTHGSSRKLLACGTHDVDSSLSPTRCPWKTTMLTRQQRQGTVSVLSKPHKTFRIGPHFLFPQKLKRSSSAGTQLRSRPVDRPRISRTWMMRNGFRLAPAAG